MVPSVVNIDPNGDLILHVHHQDYIHQFYRVSLSVLRSTSMYFNSLLDPTKFSEGLAVHKRSIEVSEQFREDIAAAPPLELPQVNILDIGQVPENLSETVFRHFLGILHNTFTNTSAPRIYLIAILVVIADRFDAVKPIAKYISRHGWMKDPTENDRHSKSGAPTEVVVRQKILIGLILRSSTLVNYYSAKLVREGSERWTLDFADPNEEVLWWHLPHGVEGKCPKRRMPVAN